MLNKITSKSALLSTAIAVDGILFAGFGLVSWIAPLETFGTIIDMSGIDDRSLTHAILASLSLFYAMIGFLCFVAASTTTPHKLLFAAVLAIGHIFVAIKGYNEIDQMWLIGDPWADIIIHSIFISVYICLIASSLIRRAPN